MIRYISLLFIFSVLFAQDFTSKDVEKDPINIESILSEKMTDLESMLIADINRNTVLEKYIRLIIYDIPILILGRGQAVRQRFLVP